MRQRPNVTVTTKWNQHSSSEDRETTIDGKQKETKKERERKKDEGKRKKEGKSK
jgi:hypothetical protein